MNWNSERALEVKFSISVLRRNTANGRGMVSIHTSILVSYSFPVYVSSSPANFNSNVEINLHVLCISKFYVAYTQVFNKK